MRRALRVLAVVGVWAGSSFMAPAAEAHHVISFQECETPDPSPTGSPTPDPSASPTPTPPPQGCVPASGSRLTGVVDLRWSVQADQTRPLETVELFILSEESGVPSPNDRGAVLSETFPKNDAVTEKTFTFPWDTASLTPHNGIYKVVVVASTHPPSQGVPHSGASGGCEDNPCTRERVDLRVDNPPKAVAAPRIVAKTEQSVSLEWDAATEPDVLHYRVFRAQTENKDAAPPYSAFKEIGTATTTSYRDEKVATEGIYWYAIIVTRRSVVTPQEGINSPPSPISKVAETVEEAEAPGGGGAAPETTFRPRVTSRLPRLTVGTSSARTPPVPDAPYSAFLPYDLPEGEAEVPAEDPGIGDPRGPVLPVAVGAFLVSSALTLGRMPY